MVEDTNYWDDSSTEISSPEPYSYRAGAYSCNRLSSESRTNWYRFKGDGSCVSVNVFAQSFSTFVAAYVGDTYQNLTCIAQEESSREGSLLFHTTNGTIYSVLVGGEYDYASGDYVLVITGDDMCPELPDNDACENAQLVEENLGSIFASSELATPSTVYRSYEDGWKTLWYELPGVMEVTCFRAAVDMQSYGAVTLFSGSDCESLNCTGYESGYETSVSWKAKVGETYRLAVSNDNSGNSFKLELGTFGCSGNDSCGLSKFYAAFPIIHETTNEFSTPAASDDPGYSCYNFPWEAKGTWYVLHAHYPDTTSQNISRSLILPLYP
jgi:hypothetical protein